MAYDIMANSSIWGSTGTDDAATSGKTDRLASDKHTFLKLLVAQLSNQDPLNPTEDKEFVAQLAQFTSLEQLQEINAGIGTLNTTTTQGQLMTATGFIGKDIVTNGDQVTKLNDANGNVVTTKVWYTVEEDVASVTANVFDGAGNIVNSIELGARMAGTHEWPWDGMTLNNTQATTGVYTVRFAAQNKEGKTVMVNSQFTARVIGVLNEDGVYKLALDGGRVVPLTDVTEITDATNTNESTTAQYVTATANASATAQMAKEQAEAARDETLALTDETKAKAALAKATSAASSASTAAKSAKELAAKTREIAESLQTAEALEHAETAKQYAEKAQEYADAAAAAAQEAKNYVNTLSGAAEEAAEEAAAETPSETPEETTP